MASRDAKIRTLSLISATLAFAAGGGAATCAFAGPFSFAPMNPASPIAAQAHEAQQHPGPYPTFAQVPPLPKDVRPVSAWRADIADTWALKRQTEAEAAAIPFTLAQGEAQTAIDFFLLRRAVVAADGIDAAQEFFTKLVELGNEVGALHGRMIGGQHGTSCGRPRF